MDHIITINVTPAPSPDNPAEPAVNFTYAPSVQRVYRGDVIQWRSTQGPFVITFHQGTPIARANATGATPGLTIDAHGKPDGSGQSFTTDKFVIPAGTIGHFHYAVAIFVQRETATGGLVSGVYIDAGCPEIIAN
jgi:hypothetical protein